MKTILSLFDYTGNWSKPYRENGYNVIQVDLQRGQDILTWDYTKIDNVYGILAAVPCTDFAVVGGRWWKDKDKDGRTEQSKKLVYKTLEIIDYFKPKFWVVENPVSRIHKCCSELGEVKFKFNPCDFAGYCIDKKEQEENRYNKQTWLWGEFNNPVPKRLEPLPELHDKIWQPLRADGSKIGWNTLECKNARSATPMRICVCVPPSK